MNRVVGEVVNRVVGGLMMGEVGGGVVIDGAVGEVAKDEDWATGAQEVSNMAAIAVKKTFRLTPTFSVPSVEEDVHEYSWYY